MRVKQGRFFFKVILLLTFILLLSPFQVIATEIAEGEVIESEIVGLSREDKKVLAVELKEVEGVIGLYQGEELLMTKDSQEFKNLEYIIVQGVKTEFYEGLLSLLNSDLIRDHVEMKEWGEFLNRYISKSVIDMPSDNIEIETDTQIYSIRGNKLAKEWIYNEVMPNIVKNMTEDSKQFPVERYRVSLTENKKWVEVGEIDLSEKSNLELVSVEYPLLKDEKYLVYNTGSVYGVILNPRYVEILQGYNGELEYELPVNSDKPASVSSLVHIVFLKNLENGTISDKSFVDMSIYEDLAVDLRTRDLISLGDLKTEKTKLLYKDVNLKEEDLILVNLTDRTVLVQPVYLECFNWGGREYNTGTWVDFTDILLGVNDKARIRNGEGYIDIRTYQDNGDILNTKIGLRNPFLIFVSVNNLPFDRLIKWIYSDLSVGAMPEEQKEAMNKTIKEMMYAQGRQDEYRAYLKAAGVSVTSPLFKIIIIVVLLVIVLVVVLLIKNKKNKDSMDDIAYSDLLFDTHSDDYNEDNEDEDNLF